MPQISEQNMNQFTVSMALMDCLPVLFFSITVSVLSLRFYSLLFFVGAFLVIAAGALKCLWKFVLAIGHKNIPFLFYQMRVAMPVGFGLILVSLVVDRARLSWAEILGSMTRMPSLAFYLIGCAGMVCMSVFAGKLDSDNPRHNWIEQGTNAVAQCAIMLGVLFH